MPISHKYKLIFIHIPKCAGISIWKSLELNQNEDSLISFIQPVLQHLLPKQLKGKYIDEKTWNSYKKFTVIRNPYDRVVSDYFWMKEHVPHLTQNDFDDYLSLREDVVKNNKYDLDMYFDHFYPMYYYFEGIKYDHVIRFENIEVEYENIRKQYNIENILTKNNQSSSNGYLLNKVQQERIYLLYKKDFIQFGYNKEYVEPISFHKSQNNIDSNNHFLLKALNKINVKIHWGAIDLLFNEDKSDSITIDLDIVPKVISFQIPQTGNIHFIQLQIGNEIGLLNINEIILKNDSDVTLWTWDKYNTHYKKDLLLIENKNVWGDKIIQLPTSKSPIFIFPIDQFQSEKTETFTFELLISTLDSKQIEILNNVSTPLSFNSGIELEKLKFDINKSNEVNNKEELDSYKTFINDLKVIQEQTSTSLELLTKEMNNIIKEKEKLSFENITLLNQFNTLKENHHKLFVQKEEIENDFSLIELNLKEAINVSEKLFFDKKELEIAFETNLNIKEKEITELKNAKEKEIYDLIIIKEKEIQELVIEIEKKHNSVALIELELNETLKKIELASLEKNELEIVHEHILNTKNSEILKKDLIIEETEQRLINVFNELEIFKNESKIDKDTITWYQKKYEHRSLFGILKDRLLKK